ncbi:hypothetical protein NSQ43_05075 [Sporosarcina sp. FSL W8-0480]|uniref:hypothetical protein n=1 Tax=Sporosarcina sp. FSL W8-0480 TaxID=2954701 RepID=UPI0030DC419C
MKKRISIISITLLLIFILFYFSSGKSIAGYYYHPYLHEKIVISPPYHIKNKIQPIIIEDKKEIKRFLNIVHDSEIDATGDGVVKFNKYLNNKGRLIFNIEVHSNFPERSIAWEYWSDDDDDKAYLFPTLPHSKVRGEAIIVSPELIEWMDEQVKINWPEINNYVSVML